MLRYGLGRDEILDRYTFEQVKKMLAVSEREERQRVAVLVQAFHTGDPQKLFELMTRSDSKPAAPKLASESPREAWVGAAQRLAGLTIQNDVERQRIQQQIDLYARASRHLEIRKENG